jgi:Regulator of Ty1 transposition protein 107 BRCT domain
MSYQALAKLGARVVARPDECTHLVLRTLARTEKLLCAMAVAPALVTEQWVRDSITTKKLLRGWLTFGRMQSYLRGVFFGVATDKYVLADPVNEKKWSFKLSDALKRAKANKGQLFAGKVFYVTNKVPLDKKLLKNVISAHGGQVSSHHSAANLPEMADRPGAGLGHRYVNKTLQSAR